MKMYRRHPEEFEFFPQTYVLPVEYNEWRATFKKGYRHGDAGNKNNDEKKQSSSNSETFIIKPENSC